MEQQLNKTIEQPAEKAAKQSRGRRPQQRKPAAAQSAKKTGQPRQSRAPKSEKAQNTEKTAQKAPAKSAPKQVEKAADVVRRTFQRRPRQSAKQGGAAVPVHLYPLGGLGEVGKNITLYECGQDMIMVDCGLVFPDSDMFGIDLVIPDFTFAVQNKDRIRGVIITHGHEDHIGSLPYLLKEFNVPVYATRLTIGLIKNKLEEHGLLGSTKLVEITPRRKFKLGCFTIEPIHVNHSIPDAVAFAIECPAGVILHTATSKWTTRRSPAGRPILPRSRSTVSAVFWALLADSTNAERPGFTATEHKVGEAFATLFRRAEKKRIIIATFASNVYRIQQIIDLAVAAAGASPSRAAAW